MNHWLVKQEPEKYPWEQLLRDKVTQWDGVRNFQARNNLRAMAKGDLVFFYRSVTQPAVMGVCKVVRTAYPDPTAVDGDWSAVDLRAVESLAHPVSLAAIKANPALANMALIRQSRLSVMPVSAEEWQEVLNLSSTRPPMQA